MATTIVIKVKVWFMNFTNVTKQFLASGTQFKFKI